MFMPSKSKIKGSNYERTVAARLTAIYNEQFIRNITGSGAYVGGTNRYRKHVLAEQQIRSAKGDITPPESFKLLNAECKSYSDFSYHQLLSGKCNQLDQWIEQLLEASDPDDCNVLFFKITRKSEWVAVESNKSWNLSGSYIKYISDSFGSWSILDIDQFFMTNQAEFQRYCSSDISDISTTLIP